MKKISLVIIILCCMSCTHDNTIKTGTYKYVRLSKFEYYTLKLTNVITTYAIGTELILRKDSTFLLTTCGNIINGKWYTKKDSLYLEFVTNRWRNDSLNQYGWDGKWPEISRTPDTYKMKNNYLIRIIKGNDGYKCMEKLKYVKQ